MKKQCTVCKQNKDAKEFNKCRSRKDGLQTKCQLCSRALSKKHYQQNKAHAAKYNKQRRQRNRQFMIDYLSGQICIDCKQKYPSVCYDFDHVRGSKTTNVSSMLDCSIETLKKEISKCEIRCSNCHRLKTSRQFNWIYENAPII